MTGTATGSAVQWSKDVDAAFERAKREHRPVMLDFSAAPA